MWAYISENMFIFAISPNLSLPHPYVMWEDICLGSDSMVSIAFVRCSIDITILLLGVIWKFDDFLLRVRLLLSLVL